MSVGRRLQDALSSPSRFFWFAVRAVYLAFTGQMMRSVARLFPHAESATDYQHWIAEAETKQDLSYLSDPSVQVAPPVAFLIATTAAATSDGVVSLGAQFPFAFPNCWLTYKRGLDWLPPVPLSSASANAGPAGDVPRSRTFLEVLAETQRETQLRLWVIFSGDGIVLEARCLEIIAATAQRWPNARLIYADHDQLTGGERHNPVFKPAWDPIQFEEHNYVGNSWAVDAAVLRQCLPQLPDERLDIENLLMRCSQVLQPGEIVHIPRILWHRLAGASMSEERAPTLASAPANGWQAMPQQDDLPLASVIIPARDCAGLTAGCVSSLLTLTQGCSYEILLVDNGSIKSATWEYYQRHLVPSGVRLQCYPGAFNFSELCNAGAASSRGRVLVLLNNDTEIISPNWLTELCSVALRKECGAVGPLLLHADGTIQHAGILMGLNGIADRPLVNIRPDHPKALDWCSTRRVVGGVLGACLAIERDKYQEVGGMDPRYAVSHNEVDLCLRLACAGYISVFTPHVRLIHLESGTRGYDLTPSQRAKLNEESERFSGQWGLRSKTCDPAYHPNFRHNGNPFALAPDAPPCMPRTGWDAAVLAVERPEESGRLRKVAQGTHFL